MNEKTNFSFKAVSCLLVANAARLLDVPTVASQMSTVKWNLTLESWNLKLISMR
jgi:hypothetical protein